MKKLLLSITALFLFNCATLVTHIENIDNYTQFEIIVPSSHFSFPGSRNKMLIMGDYNIVKTNKITFSADEVSYTLNGQSYSSSVDGRYEFLKGETCLYKFEIITDKSIKKVSSVVSIENRRRFIRLINNDAAVKNKIELDALNADIFLSVSDEDIGNLTISRYRSGNANSSQNSNWQYETGFIITIDDEEYGILAFYPKPKLYRNNRLNKIIDENFEDKVILYILMAYEGFKSE
jgi:hypothetical protein